MMMMVTRLLSVSSRSSCLLLLLIASFLLLLSAATAADTVAGDDATTASNKCDRLKASLTYTQEEAPRDLSGVLPVVVERVNQVLEGVVDVEVEWKGEDLHGRVGEHVIQCKVTRLAASAAGDPRAAVAASQTDEYGRDVVTQCFHVPFSILDTNECTLPAGHAMRHQCHSSALCINTIGSYECLCPRLLDSQSENDMQEDDNDDWQQMATGQTADASFWQRLATQQRSPWELSWNSESRTSCPSQASTAGCCPDRVHVKDGATCRAAFRCPTDPCSSTAAASGAAEDGHVCVATATCTRAATPLEQPNYTCQCPTGLMGNGRTCRPGIDARPQPAVNYDGVTATDETIRNNYYCSCTKPIVDACSGFPPCPGKHEICIVKQQPAGGGAIPTCGCKPGYVMHETYGCVDESPPILRLKHDVHGDSILRLKQGDVYKEYAVEIQDENAEEYLRSLKIAYSQPLPNGCFTTVGQFHVNYTVATPWTSPPYVRVRRTVLIEDIDECAIAAAAVGVQPNKFAKTCPALVPQCDVEAGATCVNTVGSYSCQCPKYTTGDGFIKSATTWLEQAGAASTPPTGFAGGTSCRDTHKPVIQVQGPNPKVFRVCACGGVSGAMASSRSTSRVVGSGNEDDDDDKAAVTAVDLRRSQQGLYDQNVKELIRSTAGAELCASYSDPNPKANDCIRAYDETHKGRVDLSGSVRVGEPVQQSALHWVVPYDVSDAAGNAAVTVWRDVIVEEVELADVETKFRQEAIQDKEMEIQRAVQKALKESERRKEAEIRAAVQKALTAERKQRQRGGTYKGATLGGPAAVVDDGSNTCAACPPCDCRGKFDESLCEAICAAQQQKGTCSIHEDSWGARWLFWFESVSPPWLVTLLVVCSIFALGYGGGKLLGALFASPPLDQQDRGYIASGERGRVMHGSTMNGSGGGFPPNFSMATNNQGMFTSPPGVFSSPQQQQLPGGSIFSPQPSVGGASYTSTTTSPSVVGSSSTPYASPFAGGQQQQQQQSGPIGNGDAGGFQQDIYASQNIITPRRNGEQQQHHQGLFAPRYS